MAYLDVKKYFLEISNQVLKANKDISFFSERYKNGELTEEQIEDIRDDYNLLKENYDRLAYIMYLFNLPKAKKNRKNESSQTKLFNEKTYILEHAGKEKVVDENTNVLLAFEAIKKKLEEKEDK